jgi:nucleoside-diphosphate-sugar epimerase
MIEGNGHQIRDFIHIDDVVDGLVLAGENSKLSNEIINLGTGKGKAIKELATSLTANLKMEKGRPFEIKALVANTCRMKAKLGLKIKRSIDELPKMIESEMTANDSRADFTKWLRKYDLRQAPWLFKIRYDI